MRWRLVERILDLLAGAGCRPPPHPGRGWAGGICRRRNKIPHSGNHRMTGKNHMMPLGPQAYRMKIVGVIFIRKETIMPEMSDLVASYKV